MKLLMSAYSENGLTPRVHGNINRLPKIVLSQEDKRQREPSGTFKLSVNCAWSTMEFLTLLSYNIAVIQHFSFYRRRDASSWQLCLCYTGAELVWCIEASYFGDRNVG